jgi:hypothetical protein
LRSGRFDVPKINCPLSASALTRASTASIVTP